MNRSLLLIITLVVANFGALYLLGDRAELVALISNLIGVSEIPSFLETQIIPSVRVYKRCCFR